MRPDFDLQFLQFCENEDLRILCDILMYDNNGKIRMSESISNSDEYLASYPDNMVGMWKDLASELQKFGGNSLPNFRLDTVAERCGYELGNHHDALEDAKACAAIALEIL